MIEYTISLHIHIDLCIYAHYLSIETQMLQRRVMISKANLVYL